MRPGIAFARPRADATPAARPAECGLPPSRSSTMRPSPWQVGQTFRSRPVPSQRGQVRLNFIAPAICVTLPLPLHSGQTVELPPGACRCRCRSRRLPGARYSAAPACRGSPARNRCSARIRDRRLFPGRAARLFASPAAEPLAENVLKAARAPPAARCRTAAAAPVRRYIGKIEAAETHVRAAPAPAPAPPRPPGGMLSE